MKRKWVAALSLSATSAVACANLSGLADLEVDQPRVNQIEGKHDADSGHRDRDASVADSRDGGGPDSSRRHDGAPKADGESELGPADGYPDGPAGMEGGRDSSSPGLEAGSGEAGSGSEGSTPDALGDESDDTGSVCGPTNTPENCGACGVACDTMTATSETCDMGVCSYTCSAGRSDCDMSGANTNGCECATPGCCGDACETVHSNGVGQAYYDCAAKGTVDQTEALAACTAYTGSSSACTVVACSLAGDTAVCSSGSAASCICWEFTGSNAGRVENAEAPGLLACKCPTSASSTWN